MAPQLNHHRSAYLTEGIDVVGPVGAAGHRPMDEKGERSPAFVDNGMKMLSSHHRSPFPSMRTGQSPNETGQAGS
ncbi:MAG: hypothetical protein GY773_18105 [Actinomycetia bacterium]|nr:hypothetical protein [Actinomycetes bacterium]